LGFRTADYAFLIFSSLLDFGHVLQGFKPSLKMKPNTKNEFGLKSIFGGNKRVFGSFCHLENGAAG